MKRLDLERKAQNCRVLFKKGRWIALALDKPEEWSC